MAFQDANLIEVYGIDQESGRLTKIEDMVSNNSPTIVVFLPWTANKAAAIYLRQCHQHRYICYWQFLKLQKIKSRKEQII